MRLAVLSSHPIQYYAPLLRELARRLDLHVFFAHRTTPQQQADAGFGTAFEWDVDLTSGYEHSFLTNLARDPGTGHYAGCDTPEIKDRLKEGRFDALLVFGWHLKSCIQAILAAKRLGLPVIVRGDSQLQTPRSPLKRLGKELIYPPLLRTFDAALYVGRRSRAYYEHFRFPAERLFFSPHCVDGQWFADRATGEARQAVRAANGIAQDAKVVLFAGKLLPFKRPLDVVQACGVLRSRGQDVAVLVAGSGALQTALADKAAELGVTLHLLGFQNQTGMPSAYAAADLLVLPSDGRETWGLVCNEAIACGTPIVVSDAVGCAPDLADDPRIGRAFPLGDVEAAAKQVAALLTAPKATDSLAAKNREFGIDAAATGVIEALDVVVRRRGPRGDLEP